MPKSLAFWIVFLIAVVFTSFLNWPFQRASWSWIVIFFLIGILGWSVYGPPIQ